MTTTLNPIAAGARVIAKRTARISGDPIPKTDDECKAYALRHPVTIAKAVFSWYAAGANAWIKGNNSGDNDTMAECELLCDRKRAQADTVLSWFGVKTDYPGLYPTFMRDGETVYYCLRSLARLLREASATHEVTRDGNRLFVGTDAACMNYIHSACPASVDHACKYEGYAITTFRS